MKTTVTAITFAVLLGLGFGGMPTETKAAVGPSHRATISAERTGDAVILVADGYGRRSHVERGKSTGPRYSKRRRGSLLKRYKRPHKDDRKYRVRFRRKKGSGRRR